MREKHRAKNFQLNGHASGIVQCSSSTTRTNFHRSLESSLTSLLKRGSTHLMGNHRDFQINVVQLSWLSVEQQRSACAATIRKVEDSFSRPRSRRKHVDDCENSRYSVESIPRLLHTFKLTKNELMSRMLNEKHVPSKREILKTLMKIYDSMGLIAQYMIRGKIIQQ